MSLGWLCSPASTINIMNGVHCQTSTVTIEPRGWSEMKATEFKPRKLSTLFSTPKSDENICCFQIRAATTGISRKGVMSSVRINPRPKNLRSSRTANSVPMNSDSTTDSTVIFTLVHMACLKNGSLKIRR